MRIRSRPFNIGRGLAVAAALTLVGWGAVALPAAADPDGSGDPAGNNGTVKIAPHAGGDGENTAHVSCDFDIEWYGFDEGADIVSTVEFTMQAPTSDVVLSGTEPSLVFVGGDPASGAGNDFDGEATYTLGFARRAGPAAGLPREGHRPHARLPGSGHQAQGLLGLAVRRPASWRLARPVPAKARWLRSRPPEPRPPRLGSQRPRTRPERSVGTGRCVRSASWSPCPTRAARPGAG